MENFQNMFAQLQQHPERQEKALRAQYFQHFLKSGLPTRKQEQWRFTDLSFLTQPAFTLEVPKTQINAAIIAKHKIPDTYQIVFVDGQLALPYSAIEILPVGIEILSMQAAHQKYPELITENSGIHAQALDDLNSAFWQDGIFIQVAAGVKIDKPLHCLFIQTAQTQPTFQALRHVIKIQTGAQINLIEQYVGENTQTVMQSVNVQLQIAERAQVDYVKFQQMPFSTYHFANTVINQAAQSQCQATHIGLGAQLARENIQVALQDKQAACALFGLYMPGENQQLDYYTEISHQVPNCQSQEFYKGILKEKSKAVFNGRIKVEKNAIKTLAQQKNQNLLLAKTASIHTHPQLEIYADDVQCAHGATVGELDENALFYLRARGLNENQAKYLLMEAFANEIVEKITLTNVRAFIRTPVQEQLKK